MPYRKSVFAQGCYYHVFNRGANRENIFRTEKAMVKNPEDWRYSNYLDWIGRRDGKLKDAEFVASHFKNQQDYQNFVMEYQTEKRVEEELQKYLLD